MPGCAAWECTNSSKKGYLMKTFPKDPKRRKEWALKMRRRDWYPTDSSRVCEVHFAPEMWEKVRQDGSKKLKLTAVPTIFSFTEHTTVAVKRESESNSSIPTKRARLVKEPYQNDLNTNSLEHSSNCIAPKHENTQLKGSSSDDEILSPQSSNKTIDSASEMTDNEDKKLKIKAEPTPKTILTKREHLVDESDLSSDSFESKSSIGIALDEETSADKNVNFELWRCAKLLRKKSIRLEQYKNRLRNARYKIKLLEKTIEQQDEESHNNIIAGVFNTDQMLALKKRHSNISTKFMKWNDDTIINSLKLKYACGNAGYEELLKQNLPYPSTRTLQRRMRNLKFDSGILHEVFNFLKYEVESFKDDQKDCVLTVDETAIISDELYDASLKKHFGDVTLPKHSGTATHALVFTLLGVNTRWKQIIAYYFTGDSVKGSVLQDILVNIFCKVGEINLNIISIATNAGAFNEAFCTTLGVCAGRHQIIRNTIEHPLEELTKVYYLADAFTIFKNLKTAFVDCEIIYIPKYIQEKYGLPTQVVHASHISNLLEYQHDLQFRLSPKLTELDLLPPDYDEQKASKCTTLPSLDVSGALKFLAKKLNEPEHLTTAWFIDCCEKWFGLMTAKSPANAVNEANKSKTVRFLHDFMEIINSLEIGFDKGWKPCQADILIATKSVLQILEFWLVERKCQSVLPGRFSQSCSDYLFNDFQIKQIIPKALEVKNNLKMLCVSQYLACPKSAIYDEGDRREDIDDD